MRVHQEPGGDDTMAASRQGEDYVSFLAVGDRAGVRVCGGVVTFDPEARVVTDAYAIRGKLFLPGYPGHLAWQCGQGFVSQHEWSVCVGDAISQAVRDGVLTRAENRDEDGIPT